MILRLIGIERIRSIKNDLIITTFDTVNVLGVWLFSFLVSRKHFYIFQFLNLN